jgi:hypothetical protein
MQAPRPSRQPAAQPFFLSLHIRHPSLAPAEISHELGCEPDEAFGAGEPRRSRTGAGVYGETYWVATLGPSFWRDPFHPSADLAGKKAPASVAVEPDVMDRIRRVTHAALESLTPEEARALRTRFGIDPAAPASPGTGLPVDRPSRFKLLVALGWQQGYLTDAQLRAHLPDESCDPVQLQDVVRTLAELGIPVHEQASRAVATIQRAPGALDERLARDATVQLTWVLHLVCSRFVWQHAAFFKSVRQGGGSVRLLLTLSPQAVHGLSIPPELSSRLAQLGIHLELALAGGARGRQEP